MMGKNEFSHNCNTPGPRLARDTTQSGQRVPFPKGTGLGNTVEGSNPITSVEEPSERGFPFPLKNFAVGLEIGNNRFTIVVRTTDRDEPLDHSPGLHLETTFVTQRLSGGKPTVYRSDRPCHQNCHLPRSAFLEYVVCMKLLYSRNTVPS